MKLFQSLLLSVLFVFALTFIGCNEEPTTSVVPDNTPSLSKLTLPAGAVISSATFNIYVEDPSGNNITVHKVNVPWTEAETWNSFFLNPPTQFDAASLGNFNGTAGLHTVDITALVQAWVDGTTPNNGVLLDQPVPEDITNVFTTFRSREYVGANQPFLEVTYTVGAGAPVTVQEPAFADTYISSLFPDASYGTEEYLRMAHLTSYRKYVLVKFDIERGPEVSCETSYAYDSDNLATTTGTCFTNLGFGNWGWSIRLAGTGSYTFDVYAGAGQCDITKGTKVGTVTADYSGGTVAFTYNFLPGFSSTETHFYAGKTPTPLKKGKPTVAPGQYYITPNLSGAIYIIAHAVVCSSNWN